MPDKETDVNNTSDTTSASDTKADVKPLIDASSADTKTLDPVPYERFKEVNDKASKAVALELEVNSLKERLAELDSKETGKDDSTEDFDWRVWDSEPQETSKTTVADQEVLTWDQMNEEFADKFRDRPLEAMIEYDRRKEAHRRKQIADARKIPGYDEVRSIAEEIPDSIVDQAMQNPEFIRTMMAKLKSGKSLAPLPKPAETKPATVEELLERARMDEREKLAKEYNLKLDTASAMTIEGSTASSVESPAYELDSSQKAMFSKMGHNVNDPAVVARLTKGLARANEFETFAGGL